MKKIIIVGSKGQDGQLLYKYYNNDNYAIIGIDVNHIQCYNIDWNEKVNIDNQQEVFNLIEQVQPDFIYYLAAYHHSSEDDIKGSLNLVNNSYQINIFSYLNFLEGIRLYSNRTRIFYAASSHIYGQPVDLLQDETTKFAPQTVYAITKLDGLLLSRYYRTNYSIMSSVGILYNHESHLRSDNFITKRIVNTAIEIKNNKKQKLVIGNINARIDLGYAGDYIIAMTKIIELPDADEFIIATGTTIELRDFISAVFNYLDLDWKQYVVEDPFLLKRKSVNTLCGNPKKLMRLTGWRPVTSIRDIAHLMVDNVMKDQFADI
jgi:GDPmannose 4,6-dehydratase